MGVHDRKGAQDRPAGAPAEARRRHGDVTPGVLALQRKAGNAAVGRLLARQPGTDVDKSSRRQAAARVYEELLRLKPLQVIARLKAMKEADLEDLTTYAPIPTTDAQLRDQRRVMVDFRMNAERAMRELNGKRVVEYVHEWPDAQAEAFLDGRTLTDLRVVMNALKGDARLDPKRRKRLEQMVQAEQAVKVKGDVAHVLTLPVDVAVRRIEHLLPKDLEQMLSSPVYTDERRIRVSVMLLLEQARREQDYVKLAKTLAAADDDIALAFLKRRTPAFLRALLSKGFDKDVSGADRVRIRRLVPKALAMRVAAQDEAGGLRELRYLEAVELEAVEEAGAGLSREQARAVQARVRRLRDSIDVEQVKGIIDAHVNMWNTGVSLGVLTASLEKPAAEATKKWFLIALGGNLVWAVTGFIPAVRGIWLGVKVVGQIGGAIVGSNTSQVALEKAAAVKDGTKDFRLATTDILGGKAKEFKKDTALIERVTDELWKRNQVDRNSPTQAVARRATAWEMIFGGEERTQNDIQRETVADVEAIWKWFSELWRRNADIYERMSDEEVKGISKHLLDQALEISGVAKKVGYKVPEPPFQLPDFSLPTTFP